jgi:hypothetical protein
MRATFNGFQWGGIKDLPLQPVVQFYLKTQAGWTEKSHLELSKSEEPIDTQWTVKVMGASIGPSCGDEHAR